VSEDEMTALLVELLGWEGTAVLSTTSGGDWEWSFEGFHVVADDGNLGDAASLTETDEALPEGVVFKPGCAGPYTSSHVFSGPLSEESVCVMTSSERMGPSSLGSTLAVAAMMLTEMGWAPEGGSPIGSPTPFAARSPVSPADQEWAQALLTEEDIAAALGSGGLVDVSARFHPFAVSGVQEQAPWVDWEAGVSYDFFDGDLPTHVDESIGTADRKTVERTVDDLRAQAQREGPEGSIRYDPAPIRNAVIAGFEDGGGGDGGIEREVIVGYAGRVIHLNDEGLTRDQVDQLVTAAVSRLRWHDALHQALLTEQDIAAALGSPVALRSAKRPGECRWLYDAPWQATVAYRSPDGELSVFECIYTGALSSGIYADVEEAVAPYDEAERNQPEQIRTTRVAELGDPAFRATLTGPLVLIRDGDTLISLMTGGTEGPNLTPEQVDQLVATAVSKLP
jgi:hypothetical protein